MHVLKVGVEVGIVHEAARLGQQHVPILPAIATQPAGAFLVEEPLFDRDGSALTVNNLSWFSGTYPSLVSGRGAAESTILSKRSKYSFLFLAPACRAHSGVGTTTNKNCETFRGVLD